MTGFFPVMMFGLPGAALAMVVTAKKKNRQLIAGAMISVSVTAFLTGITEPIEFLFMFMAPALFLVHGLLSGLSVVIVNLLGITNGFTFSAGAVDFIDNLINDVGSKPMLLLGVGLVIGALYFITFKILIEKFDIKTPGREDDIEYVNATSATITAVTGFADQIADGDLDFEMDSALLSGKGEVGHLARAFDKMKNNLLKLISEMKTTGQDLKETSDNITELTSQSAENSKAISEAIEDVAKGALNQASDTEVGSTESSKLGDLIELNIDRIKSITNDSSSIDEVLEEGRDQIKVLNEHATETKTSLDKIKNGIEETYKGVNTIKEVSSFIASISEQTNLLALNASIEAARAGEAGRGFAVVAEEIRKLAEASKSSTDEIDEAVSKLSEDAQKSVDIADELNEVVSRQFNSVQSTSEKFEHIDHSIKNMMTQISEMNLSTEGMHNAKVKIMEILESLAAIAEENAASTEETSASANEQSDFISNIHDTSLHLLSLVNSINEVTDYYEIKVD